MRLRVASAGLAVTAGSIGAVSLLVVTSRHPAIAVVVVVAAGVLGAGAGYAAERWRSHATGAGVLVVDGLLVAWLLAVMAYLSVPDTEGAVLVGAYLTVIVIAWCWCLGRWPTDGASAGAAVGSAISAAVIAAVVGGITPGSAGSWWVAKVVAAGAVGAAMLAAHRRFTPSEPAHPSR